MARLAHHDIPATHLLRRQDEKVVDLRPWLAWRDADVAALKARRRNNAQNPLPQWVAISGKVQFVAADGDVVVDVNPDQKFVVRNWPDRAKAVTGSPVKVLAKLVGTVNATTVLGAGRTLPLYDYGTPLPAEEITALMKAESDATANAKAAQSAVATEAELKRRAEIAARVEKARLDREAKEKQEAK